MWNTPPQHIRLSPGEVHIWAASLFPTNGKLAALHTLLTPEEHARANRFKFPHLHRRFVASQGHLRRILSRYLGGSPNSIEFERTQRGKPFLSGAISPTLHFNVSHSHEVAVYAIILEHEIGVDVEHIRPMPDAEQIATRFFSAAEQQSLLTLPVEVRQLAFFRCWTRKEAFIKAIGEGLYFPLDQFSVSLTPDEPPHLLAIHNQQQEVSLWNLGEFTPADQYVAAFAVRSSISRIRYWRADEWD